MPLLARRAVVPTAVAALSLLVPDRPTAEDPADRRDASASAGASSSPASPSFVARSPRLGSARPRTCRQRLRTRRPRRPARPRRGDPADPAAAAGDVRGPASSSSSRPRPGRGAGGHSPRRPRVVAPGHRASSVPTWSRPGRCAAGRTPSAGSRTGGSWPLRRPRGCSTTTGRGASDRRALGVPRRHPPDRDPDGPHPRHQHAAGAQGPMQFLPSTWEIYGGGGDIRDPRDAILAAARLLGQRRPRRMSRRAVPLHPSDLYVRAVAPTPARCAADWAYAGLWQWRCRTGTCGAPTSCRSATRTSGWCCWRSGARSRRDTGASGVRAGTSAPGSRTRPGRP